MGDMTPETVSIISLAPPTPPPATALLVVADD